MFGVVLVEIHKTGGNRKLLKLDLVSIAIAPSVTKRDRQYLYRFLDFVQSFSPQGFTNSTCIYRSNVFLYLVMYCVFSLSVFFLPIK